MWKTIPISDAIPKVTDLPTLPQVLLRIMQTVSDPDASVLELGELIASDPSLSATLLRVVNSACFGFSRRITSISQAIVLLGFLEVRKLALAAKTFQIMGNDADDRHRQRLWKHSLAVAMTSEQVATCLHGPIPGAFEAGLLHDIGRVAIEMLYPQRARAVLEKAEEKGGVPLTHIELDIIGFDHAEFGGAICTHWNLPPNVSEAVAKHHAPHRARLDPALTHLTAIANWVANSAGFSELENSGVPDSQAYGESMKSLGLTQEQSSQLLANLLESEQRLDELFTALNG